MFNVIDSKRDDTRNRTYYLAETKLGNILYYQFGPYTQWRNLTQQDLLWRITNTDEFHDLFEYDPVVAFKSLRLHGMSTTNRVKVKSGDIVYHLCETKNPDGFLYEVPTTYLSCLLYTSPSPRD